MYVAYRLDAPGSYVTTSIGPKASRATSNSIVPATIPEEESGRERDRERERDEDFHFGKSRDSSAMFLQGSMLKNYFCRNQIKP